MDTPQLTSALLEVDWTDADAVLGLCEDGGYWAIGLREAHPRAVRGVPMSRSDTGARQLERLQELGLRVRLLPMLRDVDTPDDAGAVAELAPRTRFGRLHARLANVMSPLDLYEEALGGATVTALGSHARFLDIPRWQAAPDEVDRRCPRALRVARPGRRLRPRSPGRRARRARRPSARDRRLPRSPWRRAKRAVRPCCAAVSTPGCPAKAVGGQRCWSTATSVSAATLTACSDAAPRCCGQAGCCWSRRIPTRWPTTANPCCWWRATAGRPNRCRGPASAGRAGPRRAGRRPGRRGGVADGRPGLPLPAPARGLARLRSRAAHRRTVTASWMRDDRRDAQRDRDAQPDEGMTDLDRRVGATRRLVDERQPDDQDGGDPGQQGASAPSRGDRQVRAAQTARAAR